MKIIAIALIIIVIFRININKKLDNYDISKIDSNKLSIDAAKGVGVSERRRRCIKGYYDIDLEMIRNSYVR